MSMQGQDQTPQGDTRDFAERQPVGAEESLAGGNPPMPAPQQNGPLYNEPVLVESPQQQAQVVEERPAQAQAILADLLSHMLEIKASDLHISAGNPPLYRLHGDLIRTEHGKLMPNDIQQMVYAILTQKQRERFEEDWELDLSYSLPKVARYRVNIYKQRDAVGAAFRLIPFEIKPIEDLGVPPQARQFAELPRGLVLVTGPTGSGKSTTLAGLIDIINSGMPRHIMSVEDPIEFLHQHKMSAVHQREVGGDTKSFAQALKHVLRQDPDVILVGEMRDLETISMALTAAETGHLVFATLHTNSAPGSVDRIIDVFPPHQQQQIRVQLAASLQGVLTQTLIPTVDGKGRAVACEILIVTPAVSNLIREGKTHQIFSAMQAGGAHGMQTMDKALAQLVLAGKIRREDAEERCHDMDNLTQLLRGAA
jgi:twitching motility protein PilT